MTKKTILIIALFCLHVLACAADRMSLAGEWRVSLVEEKVRGKTSHAASGGIAGDSNFDGLERHRVVLPGSLTAQGLGREVSVETPWIGNIENAAWYESPEYARWREPGSVKVPFWLQPERYFRGAACYEREFEVPPGWRGKRVMLELERPHWATLVRVDGREVGRGESLGTPHVFDLGTELAPGRHRLEVVVDNTMVVAVGPNAHSVSEHTQGNWNGIAGRIELTAREGAWIEDAQVYPRVANRSVLIRGRVGGGAAGGERVRLEFNGRDVVETLAREGGFEVEHELGMEAGLWDEFSPVLHRVRVSLGNGEAREVVFGLREVGVEGTQITVNGRRVFLRGTLECAAWPRTGHPPMEAGEWKRMLGAVRAHGLNHVRFHSWCPPRAAFEAADELGVYLQVEANAWPNQGATVGDGGALDGWLSREGERILREYGNHPSFMFFAAGNEPAGKRQVEWLGEWVKKMKALDSRRLCTGMAGWPQIGENEFHVDPKPRVHRWKDGLGSRMNARAPETRTDYRDYINKHKAPVVSHEIGQWCVYPNFDEIPKYTGPLKAKNFEIFQETLAERGMGRQAREFLQASGKLQVLCYKEEIESALRTPGMGGFQLLGLSDFPGQGTALVGVLDVFWEGKGYVSAGEWRRFCAETVCLARLEKRVFEAGEVLSAEIEVAHYGAAALENEEAGWKLTGERGEVVARGEFARQRVETGTLARLGEARVALPGGKARKMRLVASIGAVENDWDIWVYPVKGGGGDGGGVRVVSGRVSEAVAAAQRGETVLLSVPREAVRGDVQMGFTSIFWNTSWTKGQAPHTLGILCDPGHPALAEFPTEFWGNWQWWHVVTRAGAMILDGLPVELRPVVQVVDDWFTNRKLGIVFECVVGKGRMLVCSADLGKTDDPVMRQLGESLLKYAASPAFAPRVEVSAARLGEIFHADKK